MFYCLNDKEHKVIMDDWHLNQTPGVEYIYIKLILMKTTWRFSWWEQHYGYRIVHHEFMVLVSISSNMDKIYGKE